MAALAKPSCCFHQQKDVFECRMIGGNNSSRDFVLQLWERHGKSTVPTKKCHGHIISVKSMHHCLWIKMLSSGIKDFLFPVIP
eukprot:1008071-Ditylum_brightwellii.AAC.1